MGEVFVDAAMTLAAVDRLVHHATILEMNVESYRRRTAQENTLKARATTDSSPPRSRRGKGPPPLFRNQAAILTQTAPTGQDN